MKYRDLALMIVLALSLASCKRDEDEEDAPHDHGTNSGTATVQLSYAFMNGANDFDPSAAFQDGLGRNIRITKLKFYAHDFHVTDDDGSTVAEFRDKILLADALGASNLFQLGQMGSGHAHEVEFMVGLDSAASYGFADQTTAPAPLNDIDMTWAWNVAAGRMFIKLEGFLDPNNNNILDPGEDGFQYHGIGAAMVPRATQPLEVHSDVTAGSNFEIRLKVDLGVLVQGLGLNAVFHNDGPENQLLMLNLANAISPL